MGWPPEINFTPFSCLPLVASRIYPIYMVVQLQLSLFGVLVLQLGELNERANKLLGFERQGKLLCQNNVNYSNNCSYSQSLISFKLICLCRETFSFIFAVILFLMSNVELKILIVWMEPNCNYNRIDFVES